ncbi:MAG: DUF29 family protein [Nodosilinea sp.]
MAETLYDRDLQLWLEKTIQQLQTGEFEAINIDKLRYGKCINMAIVSVEIVSPGKTNRDRDYVQKQAWYAAISVLEYWLVDPMAHTVAVLTLARAG